MKQPSSMPSVEGMHARVPLDSVILRYDVTDTAGLDLS